MTLTLFSMLCNFLPKRSFGCQIYLTICSCIKYNIMNINNLSITFSDPIYFHVNLWYYSKMWKNVPFHLDTCIRMYERVEHWDFKMLAPILVLFHPCKYQKNANRENSQCYILKFYKNTDNWSILLPNTCKTRLALLNSSFI